MAAEKLVVERIRTRWCFQESDFTSLKGQVESQREELRVQTEKLDGVDLDGLQEKFRDKIQEIIDSRDRINRELLDQVRAMIAESFQAKFQESEGVIEDKIIESQAKSSELSNKIAQDFACK